MDTPTDEYSTPDFDQVAADLSGAPLGRGDIANVKDVANAEIAQAAARAGWRRAIKVFCSRRASALAR